MKKSIFIILSAILLIFLTYHLAAADEKISPITATASSCYLNSYVALYAVDGNVSTYWIGWHYKPYWWIMFDTGAVNQITHVNIKWYSAAYSPTDYDIQISSDGISWEDVFTGISGIYDAAGEVRDINQTARYIRLYIYAVSTPYPVLREFEAYKSEGSANQLPTAQASADPISGYAALTVHFTGSGSDYDGTIVSYGWDFGDGGTSDEQNPNHPYNNPGTYIATLTVTDDGGATDSDSVTITVTEPANQPPTAQATTDRTSGYAPLDVHFTGDTSSDPDGIIVLYYWDFDDGETSNAENPSHTYQNSGTYIAALTVTDNDGATDSTSVTITVTVPSANKVPHLIRLQGNLVDTEGAPLDGIFTLTFALYEAEISGTALWEEVQENVNVEKGLLDVELGSVTPLDVPFDKQYWLGVEVDSDGEMTPRFKLTTVPYSFRSEN